MSNYDIYFLASSDTQQNSLNKVKYQMPVKEQFTYAMYSQIEEQLDYCEVDFLKLKTCFKELKIFKEENTEIKKKKILKQIQESFDNKKNVMIIYTGSADQEGNWILENQEKIQFEDLIRVLQQKKSNMVLHLLVIADCNYSGKWIDLLKRQNCPNFSLQTSSTNQQKSSCDKKIGSYFLHNFQKILLERKNELIIEPLLQQQIPQFYGNFFKVYTCFNLQLNYLSWSDMRKALGISNYGNWPYIDLTKMQEIDYNNIYQNYIDNSHYARGDFDTEGVINGFALIYNKSDFLIYDGQMKNNKKHGKGILYSEEQAGKKIYEGHFVSNLKQGYGILYYDNQTIKYEGNFYLDKYNEYGKVYNKKGQLIYDGQFFMGRKKGKGKLYIDGVLYQEGSWNNDILQGHVKQYYPNGQVQFEGEFENGKPHGACNEYFQNGKLKFNGELFEGNYHKQCQIYAKNGQLISDGFFFKGKIHGDGIIFQDNGQKLFEGKFEHGKMNIKTGKIYSENGSEKLSVNKRVSINFQKLSDAPDLKKFLKKQMRLERYSRSSISKNSLNKKRNSSVYQQSQNDSVFTINTVKRGSDNLNMQKNKLQKKSKSVIGNNEPFQSERINELQSIDQSMDQQSKSYKVPQNNPFYKHNVLSKQIKEESLVLSDQQFQKELKNKSSNIFDFNQIIIIQTSLKLKNYENIFYQIIQMQLVLFQMNFALLEFNLP